MSIECRFYAMPNSSIPEGEVIESLDLRWAWHCLHFLLSGSGDGGEQPTQFILSGGQLQNVPEHVAIQRNSAVRAFADALEGVRDDEFAERFDTTKMESLNIYSADVCELSDLVPLLAEMRAFVARHAAEGNGILVVIL